jgi:hypothetical protein
MEFKIGGVTVEVAAREDDRDRLEPQQRVPSFRASSHLGDEAQHELA